MKMVLDYYGIKKTEKYLARISGCKRNKGVEPEGLLIAAQRLGLKGFVKDYATFKEVENYVNVKKIPVIVDWFSYFIPPADGHFSVVVKATKTKIYLQDPEIGELRIVDRRAFHRVWFDFPGSFLETRKELRIRPIVVIFPPKTFNN